ncbi:phosphatidylinositol kinase- protein kinase tor1, partial [Coemansia interrupta]
DADTRAEASAALVELIADAEALGTRGQENPVYAELNGRLRRLLGSQSTADLYACTAMLAALVDVDVAENIQRVRVMVQLTTLLRGSDLGVCRAVAAVYKRALERRWAEALGGAEKEAQLCLEWLGTERSATRRMTALLVLDALCGEASAAAVHSYSTKMLTALSAAVRDARVDVREAAGRALGTCVQAVARGGDAAQRGVLLNFLLEELQRDAQAGSAEGAHAALLRSRELVLHGGLFMQPHVTATGDLALRLKDHRDGAVARAAVALLPVLARYSPHDFCRGGADSLLVRTCSQLVRAARGSERLRAGAFAALAQVAQSCATEFRPFVERTCGAVRDVLAARARTTRAAAPDVDDATAAVLGAVATLAAALGPALTKHMGGIVDLMFATGLSQPLVDALHVLEREAAALQPAVHARLLDAVSVVLAGEPFRAAGGPAAEPATPAAAAAAHIAVTPAVLVLALRTLAAFDFSGENLSEFVRRDVLAYVGHASAPVRRAAIAAAAHIVGADPLYTAMAGAGVEVAGDVVQALVAAAVADADAAVRLAAVRTLERAAALDFHVGKAQHVQALFLLLNDASFAVRLAVLGVVGRLANMNPAHVMPPLRRTVVQLLTELEHARSTRERECSIRLLMALVRAAANWVRPYVGDIFRTALPLIDASAPPLAARLLDTVAALAQIGGAELVPHARPLLASIMRALADAASAQKRLAALQALASCASFCGLVIAPYAEYPQLFAELARLLKTDAADVREAAMRAIGALGAADPHSLRVPPAASPVAVAAPAAAPAAAAPALVGDIQVDSYGTTFSSEPNYFTSVSVAALLRILTSPADAKSHLLAVQALNTLFAPLQSVCGQYLDAVVPAILAAMRAAPPEAAESYIERLGRLVGIARQLIRPHLDPLFALFDAESPAVRASEPLQKVLIGLVDVLADALSGDFGPHIRRVVPFLLAVIDRDASHARQPTVAALHALRVLGPSLEGFLFLVMPRLIALLDAPAAPPLPVAARALDTIEAVVAAVNCAGFASRLVLTLVRLLQDPQMAELHAAAVSLLCVLMELLQDEFMLFMPTVAAAMKARAQQQQQQQPSSAEAYQLARFDRYSRLLFGGRLIPRDAQQSQSQQQQQQGGDASPGRAAHGQGSAAASSSAAAGGAPKLYVDANALRNAWSTQQGVSRDGWMDWINRFAVELLSQSPSPALRACGPLASNHPRLRSELFNAAFVSCWTELPGQYQQEVIASLQDVAAKPDVPADILQTILSLAGFMERDEKQIPIDLKLLGEYADRCHALAKELHYKEAEWALEKGYGTIEKLIELNQNLDLHDSAIGMLNYVRKEQPDIEESVEWYVRLQRWDDALAIYRQQEAELGHDYSYDHVNGQIRCLFEMSDWDALVPMYDRIWQSGDQQMQMAAANIGMSMAWAMGDIERMELYLSVLPNKSRDKSFCRALLAVYRNQFDDAATFIRDARVEMTDDLVSHVSESYSRGYLQVFRCQMLTELEEVVAYKQAHDDKERRLSIINTWRRRLDGIQQDVGMWQKLLRLRSMVLRPILDLDTWIKYVNMCRKTEQMKIARHAITQLLDDEARYMDEVNRGEVEVISTKLLMQAQEYARLRAQQQQQQQQSRRGSLAMASGSSSAHMNLSSMDASIRISQQPALVYMFLKYKWANNERREAFQMLEMFANDYSTKIGFDLRNPAAFASQIDARMLSGASTTAGGPVSASMQQLDAAEDARMYRLLARFYFKRAEWLTSIQQTATLNQEARAMAGIGAEANSHYVTSPQPQQQKQQQQQQRALSSRRESVGVRRRGASISSYAVAASTVGGKRPYIANANGAVDDNDGEPGLDGDESQMAEDAEYIYRLKGERINESILESYRAATALDSKWYKAWHLLALRHYHETQRYDMEHSVVPREIIEKHVVPAVHGFFRAIQLSKSDTTLQDTLRLLTAWFNYSQHECVAQAVLDGFNSVSLRTWLQVIPQILARIHIQYESTSRLIKQLLVEVGKFHPNAILFSLYVAARGDHPERSQAARDVLAKLHDLTPELVEETEVVSRELIRITLLFPEMWHDALDNASKYYFKQNDPTEMMRILQPLHERARNPETLREYHFVQMFGNELATAEQHLAQYFAAEPGLRAEPHMQQAWDVYYLIFRRIQKLFPDPKVLTLKDTAPVLLQCRDMHLAVPGTYDPDRDIVRIDSFDPVVRVYNTKQHPREMHIRGSDGNKYTFVLKGHEDLRQDERVMQLFGLINSLLARDTETARRALAIERFPVTPLSSNSGLIGFYPNCENIHEIIQNYRDAHGQIVNLEQRLAQQFSPNWDSLTVLQKVESFEYALSNTPGNDLQRAMWYKSPNAEAWLERRTNYTRSLAVMSIAGYILGLGDRHPSNIMMHTWTGKVVHIDFGDCFEIAAHRDKFPETVPFRLTRMFIMPMEVSTIEGLFKFTANHTMRVLRANRDSLMAVLEAFVFDPLVSWSYLQDAEDGGNGAAAGANAANGAANGAANAGPSKQPPIQPRGPRAQQQQQQHAGRWDAAANAAVDESLVMAGSRPDERHGAKNAKFNKNEGLEDKGWQTGNPKARAIVKRIHDKLVGTDFNPNVQLSVAEQIEKLIQQATSSDNLAVLYVGWVPLW